MSSGQQAPTPYQPPNQAGAASAFQAGSAALGTQGQNLYNTANSGYSQLYNQALTNPYAGQAQTAANAAGATGQAFGGQEMGYGQGLANIAGSLGQYNGAIAQTAFDPQNALYNRTQNQVTDQANATAASSGLAGSPFGAGLTNQANENFNIDWQNNQQQRQNSGIAALSSLADTQSGLYQSAGGLGTAGLNTLTQAGQLPNQVYQANQQAIESALDQLVSGSNAASSQQQEGVQDQGTYLNIGQEATQGADQAAQINNAQSNAFWSGIGSLFGTVGGFKTAGGGSIGGDLFSSLGL